MHAHSAATSSGSMAGNMAIRSWFRPELPVGLGVDDAVGPQHLGDRSRRRRRRRSPPCPPRGSARRASPRRAWRSRTARPRCRGSRRNGRTGPRRTRGPRRRPSTRPARRRAAAWPARACCRSGPCWNSRWRLRGRGRPGPTAFALSGRWRRHPVEAGRRQERHPEPAVGGEAFLGGEVIGIELARVDPEASRRRGPVDGHDLPRLGHRRRRDGGSPWPPRSRSRCG